MNKNIKFFDDLISFTYIKEKFNSEDTDVAIYDRYKISILLSDGINAVVGDRIIGGEKGCVLFFRPDEIHFGRFFASGIYSYLDIYIPMSFFEKFPFEIKRFEFLEDKSERRLNYIYFDTSAQSQIFEISNEIVNLMKSNKDNSDIKLFSYMLRIMLMCDEFYEYQKSNPVDKEMPNVVKKAMIYIRKNYSDKISLEKLAEKCNCSVAYLSRVFKLHLGITVYTYITAVRISSAQIMLKHGATVTEAAFSCGFDDCSNFIRTFKKAVGKTPMNFKKEMML